MPKRQTGKASPLLLQTWAPGYYWFQRDDRVEVCFETSASTRFVDVQILLTDRTLMAGLEGEEPRVMGELHHLIYPTESTWTLDHRGDFSVITITLHKKVPIPWTIVVKGDMPDGRPCDSCSEAELARHYEQEGEHEIALRHLGRAAEKGFADACLALARIHQLGHRSGFPVAKDATQAATFAQRAADLSSGEGMALLAQMYLDGFGVPKDWGEALKWFSKAVSQDQIKRDSCLRRYRNDAKAMLHIPDAYYRMGLVLLQGNDDVEGDQRKAAVSFSRAARLGHALSYYQLGTMYMAGKGVDKDIEAARQCFVKAKRLQPRLQVPQLPSPAPGSARHTAHLRNLDEKLTSMAASEDKAPSRSSSLNHHMHLHEAPLNASHHGYSYDKNESFPDNNDDYGVSPWMLLGVGIVAAVAAIVRLLRPAQVPM